MSGPVPTVRGTFILVCPVCFTQAEAERDALGRWWADHVAREHRRAAA